MQRTRRWLFNRQCLFNRRWIGLAALVALFFGLPMGYAEPRDGWHLESRVPSSALALVGIEDVGGMGARFEKTAISGLFHEPEMQAFFKPIQASAEEMLSSERSPFGEAAPMVKRLVEQLGHLRGQIAVALLGLDMDKGQPSLVASLDFGQHVGDFAAFLDGLRKEIDPDGNAITSYEKDGRTWWQVEQGPPITATTVDTAFVVATSATVLESVIAGMDEGSLGASEDFRSVRERVGGEDLAVLAYANVPALVDTFGAKMPEEARHIANAVGLDTVRAAAYGMAFSGDGFMDSFVLHAPGASHGIVPLLSMPSFEPEALGRVPAGAFYYEEGRANLDELVPGIRKLVGEVSPDGVGGMNDFLREMKAKVGVDLEKDVLGGLGGGAATYAALPETGGLFPELAVMLEVKDAAAFEATFARLLTNVAGIVSEEGDVIASTRTMTYRGKTLHLFELQAARGDDVVPFTPTWAILDGWLVMTLVPHAMKEIVLRGQTTTGGGLAAQEDFQSLRRVMPASAGGMTYFDLQAILGLLYDTAVPVLQTAAKPNVLGRKIPFSLDWAQLPPARTVRPYFRSLGVFSTWNKDGIAIQMHGPLPLTGALLVAASVAVPFAMSRGMASGRRHVRGPMRAPGRMERRKPPRAVSPPKAARSGKDRMAGIQAEQISSYVRVFLLTKKRLPASLDEIVKMNVAGALPDDPWGKPFKLVILDKKMRSFVVRSAGADGAFGTTDDVQSRR